MLHYLFFALVLLLSGCNHNDRHQSECKKKKFSYTYFYNEEFRIEQIRGNVFNNNLWSSIEMKIHKSPYASSNIEITVFHFKDKKWKQSFSDTLSHLYIECDSITIIDINNDGSYEFMIQRFEGMGNVKDYYCEIYGEKKKQLVKLDKFSSMINISFQTGENTFTTFEKGYDAYTGRKYFIDKNLNFKLIKEQHLIKLKDKWLKINYAVKNGKKIFKNQKLDDSLDKEFYGFLNWCK